MSRVASSLFISMTISSSHHVWRLRRQYSMLGSSFIVSTDAVMLPLATATPCRRGAEGIDRALQAISERDAWLPTKLLARAADVGPPSPRVIVRQRQELDVRARSRQRTNQLGELEHRVLG